MWPGPVAATLPTGPMTIRQSEGHTFIVRIRRPREEPDAPEAEWQGEVEHVPSRRSASFRGLQRLPEVLGRLIETGR